MLKRRSITKIARERFGISGTRMSRTLDGRCVNTIVLISPNFEANRDATNAETPAKTFAPKKIPPSVAGFTPKRR